MESIIPKIRLLHPSMGPAEKRIADYILNNSLQAAELSISELAKACGCGDATVVRFARRLGLEGYQELRIRLARDVSALSRISTEIQKEDSCFEIFQKRIFDIAASLYNTEAVLDPQALEQAAKTIMHAQRIVVGRTFHNPTLDKVASIIAKHTAGVGVSGGRNCTLLGFTLADDKLK